MPYYFLSEEAAKALSQLIQQQVGALHKELQFRSAILKGLSHEIKPEDVISIDKLIEPFEATQEIKDFMAGRETLTKKELESLEQAILLDAKPIIPAPEPQTLADKIASTAINNNFPASPKKEDLLIEKFEYSTKQEKLYNKTHFCYESPDGKVALLYQGKRTYVLKETILKMPWPMPQGYLKTSGLNNNQIASIRAYREMLFNQHTKNTAVVNKKVEVVEAEDPEEWKYKKILNTDTRVGKESYNKLDGVD
jgi:hypothetical protein